MRTTFISTLLALAKKSPDIMLLTGDLGFTVLEEFRDTLPKQFINAGVAEQNMIGMAAGMAMAGHRVFTYSIIPFTTFRCLEHIRNDICYHKLAVCVVGLGAGYSYGHMGSTHHAIEDIAVLRSIPNMNVVCPGDPTEVEGAVKAISTLSKPTYLRLGKAGEPKLHAENQHFTLGKAICMRHGMAMTIIATGNMLETGLLVTNILAAKGIDVRLISMHTIKPIDHEAIIKAAKETPFLVTIEEHSRIGGLGSAVAEILSIFDVRTKHLICSAPDEFAPFCGSQAYLRKQCSLDTESIVTSIVQCMLHP